MLRYPQGFHGWLEAHPEQAPAEIQQALGPGDDFPTCRLAVLGREEDEAYLGLPEGERIVSLSDVDADHILLIFYNSLCSTCREEMGTYNGFFERSLDEGGPDNGFKVMAIGVYDRMRDVVRFRRERGVEFPLFADERGEIFECLGQTELPVVYLLARKAAGGWRIDLVHQGHIQSGADFFERIRGLVVKAENG